MASAAITKEEDNLIKSTEKDIAPGEINESESGSEHDCESEDGEDGGEDLQFERVSLQQLSQKEQRLLHISNQNAVFHMAELDRVRVIDMLVMVNYARDLYGLVSSIALLALPTAASFVISYAMDNFAKSRKIRMYKNYLMIGFNVILWIYGIWMLIFSLRNFSFSSKHLEKLTQRWCSVHTQDVASAAAEETEEKPAEDIAAEVTEDATRDCVVEKKAEVETDVRRRDVPTKPEVGANADVNAAGDVVRDVGDKPTATIEPSLKDKHE